MNKEQRVEYVAEAFIGRIKKLLCPTCGDRVEQTSSPGGATSFGDSKPEYQYWDFHCLNEKCNKVWRVPRHLYEKVIGKWPF